MTAIRHLPNRTPRPFSLAVAARLVNDPDLEVVDLELGDWPEWDELHVELRIHGERRSFHYPFHGCLTVEENFANFRQFLDMKTPVAGLPPRFEGSRPSSE